VRQETLALEKSRTIDVDEYIAKCPKEAHGQFANIRAAIQSAAPKAMKMEILVEAAR
jgi:pectin methylesterase-like acyl-CoA thioesterase